MGKSIFVNLPVKDVAAAREFYSKMGFAINEQFSGEQTAFVVVDEHINLILIAYEMFKQNAQRDIADTQSVREVSVAIDVETRENVDKFVEAALAAGGTAEGETMDEDGVYSRGVCDLDGHRLDINCMA